ncbi:MAG: hypothetical protein ACI80S_000163 [Pseudohongiellaceae bacterium]|jgi:hypothetical protein
MNKVDSMFHSLIALAHSIPTTLDLYEPLLLNNPERKLKKNPQK